MTTDNGSIRPHLSGTPCALRTLKKSSRMMKSSLPKAMVAMKRYKKQHIKPGGVGGMSLHYNVPNEAHQNENVLQNGARKLRVPDSPLQKLATDKKMTKNVFQCRPDQMQCNKESTIVQLSLGALTTCKLATQTQTCPRNVCPKNISPISQSSGPKTAAPL